MNARTTARLAGALALVLISGCGPDATLSPATPTSLPETSSGGGSGFLATGDIRNGPIEIDRIEVTRDGRQTLISINALPQSVITVAPGTEVTLWAVWTAASALTTPPRIAVNWGAGEIDSPDHIHCGPCLLKHLYRAAGRRTVTVTLDDRAGGTTSRTFFIDVAAAPEVADDPCVNYGGTRLTINAHIRVCNAALTWGAWSDARITGGWNVCTAGQWAAWAPAVTPASLGLDTLWTNGNACAGGGGLSAHQEIWKDYLMNDAACYAGWKCCVYDTNAYQFAICRGDG